MIEELNNHKTNHRTILLRKRQKGNESVLEFHYKIVTLANKLFTNSSSKDENFLRIFWRGLKMNIKMLVGNEMPKTSDIYERYLRILCDQAQ